MAKAVMTMNNFDVAFISVRSLRVGFFLASIMNAFEARLFASTF